MQMEASNNLENDESKVSDSNTHPRQIGDYTKHYEPCGNLERSKEVDHDD